MQEECKQWDVSPALFSPALWPVYHSIMRADFNLFDQYQFTHEGMHPLLAYVLECPCSELQVITGCRYRIHALLQTSMIHWSIHWSAQINHTSYTHTVMRTHTLVYAAVYHSVVVSKCCDRHGPLYTSLCCPCMQEQLLLLFL